MKALIDVNVFIDHLTAREGYEYSTAVIQKARRRHFDAYISALTLWLIFILLSKYYSFPLEECKRLLKIIIKDINIVPLNKDILLNALRDERMDFEDAIQYYTAKSQSEINAIITRNIKDFAKVRNDVQVITPQEFINLQK